MKKVLYALYLLLFLLSINAWSATFEVGSLRDVDCTVDNCVITFKKEYAQKPLVFLMPTITNDGLDAPSSLRVMSVNTRKADIRQFLAPKRTARGDVKDRMKFVPMARIDYLVIEPGVIELDNGAKIVAGKYSTNTYQIGNRNISWLKNSNKKKQWLASQWDDIEYSDFGLNDKFSQMPGVLLEIQSTENKYPYDTSYGPKAGDPYWLTALSKFESFSDSRSEVNIALDISEVRDFSHNIHSAKDIKSETIAFVAAEGEGFIDGAKFWLGSKETPNTLDNSKDSVFYPVTSACNSFASFGSITNPIIIGSKNSRSGNNGGWVRRCKLFNNRVSFVNEEDMDSDSERRHASERVGFLLFEDKSNKPQVCSLFPGPVQTWETNRSAQIYIANNGNVHNAAYVGGKRLIGFKPFDINDAKSQGCDGLECQSSTGLMVSKLDLPSFHNPNGNNRYDSDNANNVPPVNFNDYDYFNLNKGNVSISGDMRIGALYVGKNSTLTLGSGKYWIDSINVSGHVVIAANSDVEIHTKGFALSNGATFNVDGSADNVNIFVHNKSFLFSHAIFNERNDLANNSRMKALVYSEKKTSLSNNAVFTGALSTLSVDVHNNAEIIGESQCFDSAPAFEMTISPSTAENMLCKTQMVSLNFNSDSGSIFEGQVSISVIAKQGQSASGKWSQQTIDNSNKGDSFQEGVPFLAPVSAADNNRKDIWIKSDHLGELELTATFDGISGEQPKGTYRFLPGGFQITSNPVQLIAGRPDTVTVKAMACDVGDDLLVDYTGDKQLTIDTIYSQPNSANIRNNKLELQNTAGTDKTTWQTVMGKYFFDKGIAEDIPIRYLDAGELTLTLSDPNCTKDECNLDDVTTKALEQATTSSTWQGLIGKATVKSRPYTFALCNYGSSLVENASGSSTKGNGFIPAGQTFQLKVKPVIWTDDDSGNNDINSSQNATAPVDTSGMCSRSDTPNFYANGAPVATVALTIPSGDGVKPHSPDRDGAKSGSLTSASLSNQQIKETAFSASWNEVGSIWLQADTQANYLGMDINLGRRPVGRFYPAYVEIQNGNTFTYPKVNDGNAQSGFAYLGQEFNTVFTVLPKSQAGAKVSNYALFDEDYQVQLALEAIDSSNNSFGSRLSPKGSWRGWSNTTTSMIWKLERQGSGSTTVESPWNSANSQWGLYIAENVDPTTIRSSEGGNGAAVTNVAVKGNPATQEMAPFVVTPELRYGRMRLEDVTVPVSQDAEVPVIVEYYLNSNVEFITNDDDGASLFGSNYGCSQLIFPDAMRSVLEGTPASDSINNGEGRLRVGHPQGEGVTDGYREQIRLGLRLSSAIPSCTPSGSVETSNQPWLQFNWTGEGDEDPSAVVTFGVYRGNDRIIYRGEKGMNQLLN